MKNTALKLIAIMPVEAGDLLRHFRLHRPGDRHLEYTAEKTVPLLGHPGDLLELVAREYLMMPRGNEARHRRDEVR